MKTKKKKQLEATIEIRRDAFLKKIDEYEAMTLEELQARYQLPGKKNRIGGIYREAMIEVVRRKQIKKASEAIQEGTAQLAEEPVQDVPHNEMPTP